MRAKGAASQICVDRISQEYTVCGERFVGAIHQTPGIFEITEHFTGRLGFIGGKAQQPPGASELVASQRSAVPLLCPE